MDSMTTEMDMWMTFTDGIMRIGMVTQMILEDMGPIVQELLVQLETIALVSQVWHKARRSWRPDSI
jgi:hypothetical protein